MFLIGLFSQTQIRIIGSIAISELVFFVWAPFLYIRYVADLKRDQVTTCLNFIVLAMVGCILSSLLNHTQIINAIKGFATLYGFWASIIVFYHLLRKSPADFKWYLLGTAVSFVLCTFTLQQGAEAAAAEAAGYYKGASESIMSSGAYYWITRLGGFVMWPIQGMYLQCPTWFSALVAFLFGSWSLISSASGRSVALVAIASSVLILVGGRNAATMQNVRKIFGWLILGGVVFLYAFKGVYSYSASHGLLGDEARTKYEVQTKGKSGFFQMIKGGRGEVFMGGYACIKRPIVGYGPWARDDSGVIEEYMRKFGDADDYDLLLRSQADRRRLGMGIRRMLIPGHSCIVGWWLWYGVLGLPFWGYALHLIYKLVRYHLGDVPSFYGYFAIMIPTQLWAIFFSPFGARLPWAFFFAMILLVRTVAKHRSLYQMVMPVNPPLVQQRGMSY